MKSGNDDEHGDGQKKRRPSLYVVRAKPNQASPPAGSACFQYFLNNRRSPKLEIIIQTAPKGNKYYGWVVEAGGCGGWVVMMVGGVAFGGML